ncbi:CoA transferase [Marivibrio halodurans]|uniref:CoA transferase n=1 Tax=Marivibrio halodurans TaxID=2039722 RepID=A0A8J7V1P5_9PROT|nr:CoA transferase [Marivibrio halodurans]MBP5856560.1 CoA transferase [Marivibrio halodurans]
MPRKTPCERIAPIWCATGLSPGALPALAPAWEGSQGAPEGTPVYRSGFRVDEAAWTAIALCAAGAAAIDRARGGAAQHVMVDPRHAAVEFRSERYFRLNGTPPTDLWDPIAGLYPTGDGGWVRVHTNFPHHRDGLLAILGCAPTRAAVARALTGWRALDLERAAADAGMVASALRSFAAWDIHPQAAAVRAEPLIAVDRIADAPPTPFRARNEDRPLSGVRVLDLTRVIAGPVAGRALAAHGADVLRVTGPRLPALPALDIDTGRGKRSAQLDLDRPEGAARLRDLAARADVFLQSYRPGALAARGFSAEALAARRPGLVHAELSAYGFSGPWAGRRGFDSLVQAATGFNLAEAAALGRDEPTALPAQALDHGAGYLLAFGIEAALLRRAVEGGSWRVRVSLARVGQWLRDMGPTDPTAGVVDPEEGEIAALSETVESPFGAVTAIRHAGGLSRTPPRWARPPVPLDHHPADW